MKISMLSLYRGYVLCCVLVSLATCPLMAQNDTSFPFTNQEIKRVTNRFFGSLVTSNSSSGVLGNFASIDPVGTSFKFQGTASIGGGDTTKKNSPVSFFSFSAKGDMFGQHFGTLFSNSSLNTGLSLTASYHLLIKKPKVSLSYNQLANYRVLKANADRQYTRTVDQLRAASKTTEIKRKLSFVVADSSLTQNAILIAINRRDSFAHEINRSADLIRAKSLADSVQLCEDVLWGLEKKMTSLLIQKDSLEIAQTQSKLLSSFAQGKAEIVKNVISDSLLMSFPFVKHQFAWVSFTGGGGKQSYSTYDANAVFDQQIQKAEYNTYQFGISYNLFKKNILNNVIQYYNVGVSRQRTNNIDLLSTKSITDTRKIVNGAGDITRIIEKKHSVYTDPIIHDEGWKFFLNSYILFGKKPSGVHFFPELNFNDNKNTVLNVGLGYIVSFINTKKDQPVINAEVFFKFLDMTDQGGSTIDGVWNRNQLGVNFTLPINLFTK